MKRIIYCNSHENTPYRVMLQRTPPISKEELGKKGDMAYAYKHVPLAEVEEFENKLANDYKSYWAEHGSGKKVFNAIKGKATDGLLVKLKIGQLKRLESYNVEINKVGTVITMIGFLAIINEFVQASKVFAATAKHNVDQQSKFDTFVQDYETAYDEQQLKGRVGLNRAINLQRSFFEYFKSLGISDNDLAPLEATINNYINKNCDP